MKKFRVITTESREVVYHVYAPSECQARKMVEEDGEGKLVHGRSLEYVASDIFQTNTRSEWTVEEETDGA